MRDYTVNRRALLKMGVGSLTASLAWPAFAGNSVEQQVFNAVLVYHDNAPEGRAFFEQALAQGGEAFRIPGELDPVTKRRFYQRLVEQPTLVVGLTDPTSAFELQMAASDAFHFNVPKDRFTASGGDNDSLLAWAVAPVAELNGGEL